MAMKFSMVMIGREAYEWRMRTASKRYRKALRKKIREAGKVTQKAIRSEISARGWSRPAKKTRLRVFVSRFSAGATIKPAGKTRAYMGIHEFGATVNRRGKRLKRGGRGRSHVARYRQQPTYRPGVRRASAKAVELIGESFEAV